jgi:GTP-binding protein HflX
VPSSRALEDRRERVVLVGLARSQGAVSTAEASLDELEALADTAGADTVDRVVQVRNTPDPATYVGKGKAKQIVESARMLNADSIIFDEELSPAQGRNLEDVAAVNPLAPSALKILDRTGLILDVFAQHAHSAEGKLQVELAQIDYMVPRLRGWGEVLSRIGGGRGSGGGPIGTRGPGETQLETDRRRIQRRLQKLKKDLKGLEKTRQIKRRKRDRASVPQISLVGYTNAGKSTLLNALTGAGVLVEDRLFSTLDPVTRRLALPNGTEAVLTDTVGFVKKLPHQLVQAFRSTLEETVEADLLLHVVDASAEEPEDQVAAVEKVLGDIEADEIPQLIALNKIDLIEKERSDQLVTMFPEASLISAAREEGLEELLELIRSKLDTARRIVTFKIPFDRGDIRSALHDSSEVLEESSESEGMHIVVRTTASVIDRYRSFLAVSELAEQSVD